MGNFKIEIEAVGGHGGDRKKKTGEKVNFFDGGHTSPDAMAKMLVENLRSQGMNIVSAKLIHWPNTESTVVDNLDTGVRESGQFTEATHVD